MSMIDSRNYDISHVVSTENKSLASMNPMKMKQTILLPTLLPVDSKPIRPFHEMAIIYGTTLADKSKVNHDASVYSAQVLSNVI
jgi:hypothetical protein